jgi:NAD(P)-dependent dehydrogenase (short-subunit alcohol dehydrogenase family)
MPFTQDPAASTTRHRTPHQEQGMAEQDKVAIVTGGGSGIGESCAKALARRGFAVVVSDLDTAGGERVVKEITTEGGNASFFAADVSDPEANEALVAAAVERHGRLDAAVNNAGIGGEMLPTGDYTVEEWRKVLGVNLDGVFYGVRAQLPRLLEQGGGTIVNMASILGRVGFAGAPAYVAAKHGVVGLTKQIAQEYAAAGIRANSVGPGFVRTPLLERPEMTDEMIGMLEQLHPIGRLGAPEELGEVVAWLCDDAPDFLNGAYIPVDGGYLTR